MFCQGKYNLAEMSGIFSVPSMENNSVLSGKIQFSLNVREFFSFKLHV